jgi:uncharacterized membrane-anchored protein YjiN (DUF445 family)
MTNPFAAHRSDLFADRETVDEALNYAHEVFAALVGSDRAAAMTAVMVVVNTAAKLWPAPVQADPARALLADMVRELVDARIEETATDLEEKIEDGIRSWMNNNLEDHVSSEIGDYIRNNVTISIDTI